MSSTETEWIEVRPGVLERTVTHGKVKGIKQKYQCFKCKTEWPMGFMLRQDLWKRIAPNNGCLCLICVESLLGRKLTASDLTDAPINREWKHFLS